MAIHLGFATIVGRLVLTAFLGGLLGLDRSEHGHSAGLRTTLLVSLAACASMLQANLLMTTVGKPSDSFVVLDLMRFPLGILTGVGFIGAGAIVRRGDRTQGVTTAATLWFVTVMGLCLGGGQLALGTLTFILGASVLWPMRWIEHRLPTIQHATLSLTFLPGSDRDPTELRHLSCHLRDPYPLVVLELFKQGKKSSPVFGAVEGPFRTKRAASGHRPSRPGSGSRILALEDLISLPTQDHHLAHFSTSQSVGVHTARGLDRFDAKVAVELTYLRGVGVREHHPNARVRERGEDLSQLLLVGDASSLLLGSRIVRPR